MNKPQTIFRVVHDPNNPYVIIDKRPFEKPYMSWKAKGLLGYLLSRPDDWTVRLGDLVKRSTDKMHATRQALRELVMVGHVRQVELRDDGGKYAGTVYEVHERPLYENPLAVYPKAEKRILSNIESTDKELNEREIDTDKAIFTSLSELTGGGLNSETPRLVDTWKEKHTLFWILKAVGIAKEKGARSMKYIDAILVGWEANGYPKSREDRVKEKRNGGRPPREADKQATGGSYGFCSECGAIPCQCDEVES
jgi:hypothetical protein